MPKKKQKQKKPDSSLDMAKFGKRIRYVRENVLKINQSEMAENIGISQALLSRLEQGIGGNIHMVFDIVNFFHSRNIAAKELFNELFNEDLVQIGTKLPEDNTQLELLVTDLKKTINSDLERLLLLLAAKK